MIKKYRKMKRLYARYCYYCELEVWNDDGDFELECYYLTRLTSILTDFALKYPKKVVVTRYCESSDSKLASPNFTVTLCARGLSQNFHFHVFNLRCRIGFDNDNRFRGALDTCVNRTRIRPDGGPYYKSRYGYDDFDSED